jgi:hypothetical protein
VTFVVGVDPEYAISVWVAASNPFPTRIRPARLVNVLPEAFGYGEAGAAMAEDELVGLALDDTFLCARHGYGGGFPTATTMAISIGYFANSITVN